MTDQTKIEWTDFTVNFWEGCQKVGPGCDNCYAEARDIRFTGGSHWGPGEPRRKVKGGIAKLRKINREAEEFRAEHGHWPRVFCSSLSDIFDNAIDPAWRDEALREIGVSTSTRVQLLTKRVGNVEAMIRDNWKTLAWPQHVGLMITVVNQAEAERDIPKLLDLKACFGIPWIGLSVEPMLGPIDLTFLPHPNPPAHIPKAHTDALKGYGHNRGWTKLDWVICGGESGPNSRPMHPAWAQQLRCQCDEADVPFFFKQWGEYLHESCFNPHCGWSPKVIEQDGERYMKVGKAKARRFLQPWGEINEMPEALK